MGQNSWNCPCVNKQVGKSLLSFRDVRILNSLFVIRQFFAIRDYSIVNLLPNKNSCLIISLKVEKMSDFLFKNHEEKNKEI